MRPPFTVEAGFGSTWKTADASITWTDITEHVLVDPGVSAFRGSTSAFGKPDVGTLSLTLENSDRRFDPEHSGSPHDGDLKPGVPVRVGALTQLTWDGAPLMWGTQPLTWDDGAAVWRGFVKSWPQSHDHDHFLTVPLEAFDGFSRLSRDRLADSVLEYEILENTPKLFWPLDDPVGSGVARDLSHNEYDGAYRERVGVSEVDGLVLSEFNADENHAAVTKDAAARLSVRNQFFVCAAFVVSETPSETVSLIEQAGDANNTTFIMAMTNDGRVGFASAIEDNLGGLLTRVDEELVTTARFDDGELHSVVARCVSTDVNEVTTTLWVDGTQQATTSWTPPSRGRTTGVSVGGPPKSGDAGHLTGLIAAVAYSTVPMQIDDVAAVSSATLAPWDEDTTDERIANVLDTVEWPADLRSFETGKTILGPAKLGGAVALEYLRRIAATEDGKLFMSADGKLRFLDRHWPWTATEATTSQATISDQSADDLRYRSILRDRDDELIVNSATVTTAADGVITIVDETSIDTYGEAAEQIDTVLTNENQARALAQWVITNRAEPQERLPSIRVGLHSLAPAEQAQLLGLDLYHRVTVKHQPHGVGTSNTSDYAVAGIRDDIGAASWWREFFLEPAPDNNITLFTLGTSQLSGTHVLAH